MGGDAGTGFAQCASFVIGHFNVSVVDNTNEAGKSRQLGRHPKEEEKDNEEHDISRFVNNCIEIKLLVVIGVNVARLLLLTVLALTCTVAKMASFTLQLSSSLMCRMRR